MRFKFIQNSYPPYFSNAFFIYRCFIEIEIEIEIEIDFLNLSILIPNS
jgi:hypothetical protein